MTAAVPEPQSIHGRDLALMLVINLVWGFNLVTAKIGVGEFPPVFFTALRFGSLALLLAPLLRLHRGQMVTLAWAVLLTGPVSFGMLFMGLARAHDASTVAIASQLNVPFTTVLSVWLLGERVHWRRAVGISLAFAGVMVIGLDPRVVAYRDGLLLTVGSAFTAALGIIYVKRLRGVRPLELQAWIALAGGSALLLLSFLIETGQAQAVHSATWRGWCSLAYTALLASLFAHTCWYYLIGRYPVASIAPVTLLSPLFSVFFGVTVLGDRLTPRMVFGSAVALTGVFIVLLREKRLPDTGS